ncbi:wd repeat-containing protein [Anaeramoeba flamelloides]|uniref:Wd repeat-containing protein n=1 Tax=Anaeramoeba flamelloides TaxID=1746091 RepID=A0AAV7ZG47_9EUKA|nr:wd repeat-containing protein [Anaeramoeba flamelloides]
MTTIENTLEGKTDCKNTIYEQREYENRESKRYHSLPKKNLQNKINKATTSETKLTTASKIENSSGGETNLKTKSLPINDLVKKTPNKNKHLGHEELEKPGALFIKNIDTGELIPFEELDQKVEKGIDPKLLKRRSRSVPKTKIEFHSKPNKLTKPRTIKPKPIKTRPLKTNETKKQIRVRLIRKQEMEYHKKKMLKKKQQEIKKEKKKERKKLENRLKKREVPLNRISSSCNEKTKSEFSSMDCIQVLKNSKGTIWALEFSPSGKYLATAGQDTVLRIWRVLETDKERSEHQISVMKKSTERCMQIKSQMKSDQNKKGINSLKLKQKQYNFEKSVSNEIPLLDPVPWKKFLGHELDILDISWSKHDPDLILTSSSDKTVRLWNIQHGQVNLFFHSTFVTYVEFSPTNPDIFFTGNLDNRIFIWNIYSQKPIHITNCQISITSGCIHPNGNKFICGTENGFCYFYNFENNELDLEKTLHVKSKRGKNKKGKQITNIQYLNSQTQILVTSNDSRIRLYDINDKTPKLKFKGHINKYNPLKSHLSQNEDLIICGSEDGHVYFWNTENEYAIIKKKFKKFQKNRKHVVDNYEKIKISNAKITNAKFIPKKVFDIYSFSQKNESIPISKILEKNTNDLKNTKLEKNTEKKGMDKNKNKNQKKLIHKNKKKLINKDHQNKENKKKRTKRKNTKNDHQTCSKKKPSKSKRTDRNKILIITTDENGWIRIFQNSSQIN